MRDAIGREQTVGVPQAREALFSLPSSGRLLVESRRGSWVVRADGSRRLLGRYRDPAWSPHGHFVAAVRGNALVALDPKGKVRWSLPRRGHVSSPTWTGLAAMERRRAAAPGRGGETIRLFSPAGRLVRSLGAPPARFFLDAAFRPGGDAFAYTLVHPGRNRSGVYGPAGRQLFAGAGWFVDLAWSPDARWLTFAWPEADQWVFLGTPGVRKIQAVSNVSRQLGRLARVTGWCCAPEQ